MKTALPDYVAQPFYDKLTQTVNDLFKSAESELEDLLSTYGHLFDGTDEAENKKFTPGSNFDFDEAVEKISQYQQIVAEVAKLPVSKDFSIVMLDYEDAKRGITGRFFLKLKFCKIFLEKTSESNRAKPRAENCERAPCATF